MESTGRLVTSTRHEPNAINGLVAEVLAGAGLTDDVSGTWTEPLCATQAARSSVDPSGSRLRP